VTIWGRHICCGLVLGCGLVLCTDAWAQQTVFNVPSGDVLDGGKFYGELDLTYDPNTSSGGFTPRIVAGIGHSIEVGLNLNGIGAPGLVQTTPTPTLKWKAYEDRERGWALLVGDEVFIPVQNRAYHLGDYAYAEFTKTWRSKTRLTLGAYHFTHDVVGPGEHSGGQFAIEQPVGQRVTLAADWYTGKQALGYVTPGVVVKVTSKFTWYGSYQIGNSGVANGNHQFLTELGWNFN
jgi:hypothetical protein